MLFFKMAVPSQTSKYKWRMKACSSYSGEIVNFSVVVSKHWITLLKCLAGLEAKWDKNTKQTKKQKAVVMLMSEFS